MTRRVLVSGATGYIGGLLVPRLLEQGDAVRVLTRSGARIRAQDWADRVEVALGDVGRPENLPAALQDVEVAYYLVHSMDGSPDFVQRDREAANAFARAAEAAGVSRLVYLGGLHPSGELSEHLASRVEVGEIFLRSPVPAAVLQAGVVLGDGSASFDMLRHLTERLPAMVTPRWVDNLIQPIAIDDALHYLVAAASLPATSNRTWDIGGPDVMSYREMMQRYAALIGLRTRWITRVPVLTPSLASHWVAAVTPVRSGIARPLVGSLVHDAVCREHDAESVMGPPPGGPTGYEAAVRAATRDLDLRRWSRTARRMVAATSLAAVAGSLLTNPSSAWYRALRKPSWMPPAAAFPAVWSLLYADIAATSTLVSTDLAERGHPSAAADYERALWVNLVLNAGWSAAFFRARSPRLATLWAIALAASSTDLVRRAKLASPGRAAALSPYAAWCGFAAMLTAAVARLNRSKPTGD